MEQQTVKSMTNEQLIGACVWLDREQKKSRAMMNSYKAELQARGLAIMEDHNVKYVKFYGDEGSAAITDSMSLDILTPYNFTNKDNAGRIKYIVIHYVGALGGAEANCKYYASKYLGASAHYFVGFNGEVWQSVEDEDIAWHCGASSYKHAECRNSNSIGIEMCVRNKGSQSAESKDWYFEEATVNAAIELTKYLMQKYGVPASNVIRHHDVTGKICPNPYVYNSTKHTWDAFKKAISGGTEQKDSMTKITGKSEATAEQMTAYIKAKNGSVAQSVLDMIPLYLSEGEAENIRGDIAFAQSCLETGNFTFSGSAVEQLEERTAFLKDCTKYGNKTAEQQSKSYDTMMMYEVKDLVDDLLEIVKAGGTDV